MTNPNIVHPSDPDFELIVWLILVKGETMESARRVAQSIGNQD